MMQAPLLTIALRSLLLKMLSQQFRLFSPSSCSSDRARILATLCLLAGVCATASTVPSLGVATAVVGASGGVLLIYIIPGMFLFRLALADWEEDLVRNTVLRRPRVYLLYYGATSIRDMLGAFLLVTVGFTSGVISLGMMFIWDSST